MIVDDYREQYEFNCRQCDHTWKATYEVRQVEDAQGGVWHHYSVAGSSRTSPSAGVMCPNCKQSTITYQILGRHRLPVAATTKVDDAIEEYFEDTKDHRLLGSPDEPARLRRSEEATDAPEPFAKMSKIVVGIDGSPNGLLALRWAAAEALARGAVLEIAVAWEREIGFGFTATAHEGFEDEARRRAEGHVTEALSGAPSVPLSITMHRGRPAHVLVEASRSADLLVVGARGHHTLAEVLLGPVSEHCVRHASCSVVVVRDEAQRGGT